MNQGGLQLPIFVVTEQLLYLAREYRGFDADQTDSCDLPADARYTPMAYNGQMTEMRVRMSPGSMRRTLESQAPAQEPVAAGLRP